MINTSLVPVSLRPVTLTPASLVTDTGAGISAIISANLKSSLTFQSGPQPTFAHATSLNVLDQEGILRNIPADGIACKGARAVENISGSSDPDWYTSGAGVTVNNAATFNGEPGWVSLTFASGTVGSGNRGEANNTGYTPVVVGTPYISTLRIALSRSLVGSEAMQIRALLNGGNASIALTSAFSPTTETRVGVAGAASATTIYGVPAVWVDVALTSEVIVYIKKDSIQHEDTTGRSDTTTPSEFVSKGVLPSPYHGANIDGLKYFPFDNGNSVSANVVTEARGIDLTGLDGILLGSQRTNSALYNRDLTNAVWVKTNITAAKDAVGRDGSANGASTLTATAANGTCFQTVTLTSAAYATSFWVRRKTGTGTIEMTDDGGSGYTVTTLTTAFQRFFVSQTQANPSIGFRIVVSGDEIEVDYSQCEAGTFPTSEIETTTAPVQNNKTQLSFSATGIPINNFSGQFDWTPFAAAQGTVFLWASYVDANNYTGVLLSGPNIITRKRISGVNYDATKALAYVAGTTYNIDWRFNTTDGVDIFADGVKGTTHTNTADCQIGATYEIGSDGNNSNQQYGSIKDYFIYSTALTDAQIT